jgi:hypothetical protein
MSGIIGCIHTVEKPRWRRASTVAGVLLAVGVGAVALLVSPMVIGSGECEGADCSDIVTRQGTQYVVTSRCDAVQVGHRRSPDLDGTFTPASRASEVTVTTFAIADLPADEVIAVEGPTDVICPNGPAPGHGVAFSSKTDAETTSRRIATIVQR